MDLNDTVYCLACRISMPATEAICPACGTDQDAARTQRMQAASQASATRTASAAGAGGAAGATSTAVRSAGGTAKASATVEPRTEYVPCPNCNVPVAPDRSSCGYCGHMMDDPDAQRRFEVGYSKIYVTIGAILAILALIPFEVFPYQLFILSMSAVVMGRIAQAENRFGIAGPVVVAMGFGSLLIGWTIRWILIGMAMSGG